jgi:hypothetical protein
MNIVERVNYYAKGVIGITGAIVVFGTVVIGTTSDGHLDGGELTTLITSGVTLIATVIGIIKKRNIPPEDLV